VDARFFAAKLLIHPPVRFSMKRFACCLFVSLYVLNRAVVDGQELPVEDSYPVAESKKGLQVEMVDDAIALGVKHAALNVNLAQLIDPAADGSDDNQPRWMSDGRTFYFDQRQLADLDRRIKQLSDHGIVVHLIILVYESGDPAVNRILLHPGYDNAAPNHLGAFNTKTEEGRQWFTATMGFLANRWSRPDEKFGRVAGYILGNEVNSHWWWSNMGRVTMQEFADDYHDALRLAHSAIRARSSWARIYVSLEHHWNMRYEAGDGHQTFAARAFLDHLAKKCRAHEDGDFDWHVAFHPYPENLFEPRFWNDKTALPGPDSPRVTFRNLSVLTEYLKRPELLYDGQRRRVILSEQGFHTPDGPDGEAVQAAAYCYAYMIAEANDGIDAFILHRHVDHPHEGGLRLGLRRFRPGTEDPRPAKKIYECFRDADTPQRHSTFEFALSVIGIDDWNAGAAVLRRDNLVAWCIVPFDAKKRSPADRALMLKELGITRCAFDWRADHVPTFEQEILEYEKQGIEYFAFWSVHEDAFRLFEKYDLHPQIWHMFGEPDGDSQEAKVEAAAQQLLPLAERTKAMGCPLGLYNHGGWSGEPANLVAVCQRLRELKQDHVGIVYNFHHGHAYIDDWAASFALMQPYLHCLNLNGMNAKEQPKILGIGKGAHELDMIRTVVESGYRGPIGILDHREQLDARESLLENRDGLERVRRKLESAD